MEEGMEDEDGGEKNGREREREQERRGRGRKE